LIKELTKLANHLDAKGLRIEAEALEQVMIRLANDEFSIAPGVQTSKKLDELGLDRRYFIVRSGDPYRYVYVPQDNLFLVVEYTGTKNRGGFDNRGYPTRDIEIREGQGGWGLLAEEARELGLMEEHQEPAAEGAGLRAFEYNGWTQYRNPDDTIAYYIDDAGMRLERIDSATEIAGTPIGQVSSRPRSPNIWTEATS
tara:strand:+ start:28427 stop:29020 length:594 start_codon:yes stop_codon:yes gene_type:complete